MTDRPTLDDEQRRRLSACGRALSSSLSVVVEAVRPGIVSTELDQLAERELRRRGAAPSFKGYRGYPAALCVSRNDEVVHGIPASRKVLQDGDVVGLDLGAVMNGWYTDMATSVVVGRSNPAITRLLDVTQRSLAAGLAVVRAGARVGDIGAAVQQVVEQAELNVVRELVGHGVGRAVHEDPPIPNFGTAGSGSILRVGDILAIEPMVTSGRYEVKTDADGWTVRTVDGSLAAHEERTIIVTIDGYELVTPWPES